MKKIWCCLFMVMVSGCSLSARESKVNLHTYPIEEQAQLNVTVDDKQYGDILVKLWNQTYPKHAGALKIHIKSYQFSQHIQGDIDWVKDSDIAYKVQEAYPMEHLASDIEYGWESHLQRAEYHEVFLPIEGRGLLFVYNEATLQKRKGKIDDLKHMETLQKFKGDTYYHNRLNDYVYPLVFQGYEPLKENEISMDTLFHDKAFAENLTAYKALYNKLDMEDDISEKKTFYYDDHYICGLVQNDKAYEQSEAYQKGHLHFMNMPMFKGKALSPVLDTYGFMVNKHVKYPNAAKAFLQLVRSKEGIISLLDHTKKYPLVKKEDIEDFHIFDVHKKEILAAMNGSQLRSTLSLQERMSITFDALYNKSNFLSILQNYLFTKETGDVVQKKIIQDMKEWVSKR